MKPAHRERRTGRASRRRAAGAATGDEADQQQGRPGRASLPLGGDVEALERRAWSDALRLIARRDMAEQQLRRALLRKGHGEPAAEATIERLRRERYLDDASLAARYARSRLEFGRLGQHRVRQGLRQRGVAGAIIEDGIRHALGEVSEADVVDGLARRYWTQRRRDEPGKRLRGLWAFLMRRGFPAALVHERLRALWPRWSDALAGLDAVDLEQE